MTNKKDENRVRTAQEILDLVASKIREADVAITIHTSNEEHFRLKGAFAVAEMNHCGRAYWKAQREALMAVWQFGTDEHWLG